MLDGKEEGSPGLVRVYLPSRHRLVADLFSVKVKEFYEEVSLLLDELPESGEVNKMKSIVSESRLFLSQIPLDLHFLAGLVESKQITED